MHRFNRTAIFTLAALGSLPARAEFVPGHIYLSAYSVAFPDLPTDAIYEFDPSDGSFREFARMPQNLTGSMTGLSFTPDGSRLRASVYYANAIVEIDGAGNVTAALDYDDGIRGPYGSNNIAYGPNGDFFVGGGLTIQRFPAGGGPGEILADVTDGISGSGPIAVAPDGAVFYGKDGVPDQPILRIEPGGSVETFDVLPHDTPLYSLAIRDDGDIFALCSRVIYHYDAQEEFERFALTPFQTYPDSSITLSPDGQSLLVANANGIWQVDIATGQPQQLGVVFDPEGWCEVGKGIAVAVPEPAAGCALLSVFLIACLRRR